MIVWNLYWSCRTIDAFQFQQCSEGNKKIKWTHEKFNSKWDTYHLKILTAVTKWLLYFMGYFLNSRWRVYLKCLQNWCMLASLNVSEIRYMYYSICIRLSRQDKIWKVKKKKNTVVWKTGHNPHQALSHSHSLIRLYICAFHYQVKQGSSQSQLYLWHCKKKYI